MCGCLFGKKSDSDVQYIMDLPNLGWLSTENFLHWQGPMRSYGESGIMIMRLDEQIGAGHVKCTTSTSLNNARRRF